MRWWRQKPQSEKTRMNLFDKIQSDILGEADLSTILREAKVLAYRLKNQEFKEWVEYELNGYRGNASIPKYRSLGTVSCGDFINLRWRISGTQIPLQNFPDEIQEIMRAVDLRQGVKELESMVESSKLSKDGHQLRVPWPRELIPLLSNRVYEYTECIDAWQIVTRDQLKQVLESIRNNLLSFILELGDRYPEQARADFNNPNTIPDDQIRQVFNYFILGGSHKIVSASNQFSRGGSMSVFDQRHQKVNYQYNAAGNINFDRVESREDVISILEKIKAELASAASAEVIDAEIVTDADYQITKAIQQSQKAEPNKKSILEHLKAAKEVVEGVASTGEIALALVKASEWIEKLF